jgi:superfamily II DNA or RNA helicase
MQTEKLNDLAAKAGVKWFDYQLDTLVQSSSLPGPQQRACLYYKTGAGKSITALAMLSLWGQSEAVVITPPSTYPQWQVAAKKFGIEVELMSHAKFRMKDTLLSRSKAIIADEMHLFGGHSGKGWAKLDRLARGLQAPLILASATPNYNDADRVYCIQHILDPHSCKGGFLEFLYAHCETEQNMFGRMPIVTGFRNFDSAAEYLAALPHVYYLPDDLVYSIVDLEIPEKILPEMDDFGLDRRRGRIIASGIEEKHQRIFQSLVEDNGLHLYDHVYEVLTDLAGGASTPVLIYANHSTVAVALGNSLHRNGVKGAVVTGSTPAKMKAVYIDAFKDGVLDVLVGTASLATGTDGMDKMCDVLIILDDTDDDSLRRQLIGRIMPRGADGDASKKQVYRLVLTP